jgi:hypothetical protein
MKFMLLLPILFAMGIASCGVETASTAATAAALKQKELEAGRKTMNDVQQSIGQSMQKVEESAQKAADADKQ